MNPDEIKSAVVAGIAEAFKNPGLHCRYQEDPKIHSEQHKKMDAFLETMARIDNIKWEVGKAIAKYLALGLVILMGYGALGQIGKYLGIVR